MAYKKQIIILGSSAVFLAVLYVLALVFDPARINARNERFTWFPAVSRDMADKIEIIRGENKFELFLRNGVWFVQAGSAEVPAKQGRVDDLFRLLSTRGAFPRRGSNAVNHSEIGLGENAARVVIRGGAGVPLLDLLVGNDDSSGREVFLRKSGENEFRSGDRLISSYVNGNITSWCDLKFFEEKSLVQVQRVVVNFSGYTGISEIPVVYRDYTITRSGDNWVMDGVSLDKEKTESWIQGILEAQGEDFSPADDFFDPAAQIRVELGDGSVLQLQVGAAGEDGRSLVMLGGKAYLLAVPQWTITRLLKEREYF